MDQLSKPTIDYSDIFHPDTGQEEGQTFVQYLIRFIRRVIPLKLILATPYIYVSIGITVWQIENFLPVTVEESRFTQAN